MFYKKTLGSGLSLVLIASLITSPANASEKATPRSEPQSSVRPFSKKVANRPAVVSVVASRAKSKRVNITVTLQLGAVIQGAAPTGSEVRVGNNICRMTKSKTKCTIRNVAVNSRLRISARTRNSAGFSKWSKSVSFRATSGHRWSLQSGTPGNSSPGTPGATTPPRSTTPTLLTNRSLSRLLKTQATKFSKFQALSAPVVTSSGVRRFTASGNITFRVSSIIGLAQTDTNMNSGSGLFAVSTTGDSFDALATGTATISQFHVGPDGKFYVLFSSPTPLVVNGPNCLLAEVSQQSGIPTCIDNSLTNISWGIDKPIQFDSSGRLYFVGDSNGRAVLRRYAAGQATDLINDNVTVNNFEVLPDGTVLLSGTTTANSTSWVRRLTSANSLSTLVTGASATFMQKFPDGNIYFGLWGNNNFGVRRYVHSVGSIDSKYWIAGNMGATPVDRYFDAWTMCQAYLSTMYGFCGAYGANVRSIFSSSSGSTFAVSGIRGQSSILMQYFPTVQVVPTVVKSVTSAMMAGSKIVVAGTNEAGRNVLTIFDPAANSETIVLDAENEVEMYSLAYSASQNRLLFSGLQFSNNTVVTGEIVLP
ncbi:unannotated protein [freshwater metagenome]|uniref:Unannotated protein n=1 Tax=freshwater metagenome TaxID=449393 RepID=A0A6J6L7D4_9ZZZZ